MFSGIGGFALAARWAGFETVAFCESNPWCQKILRKHWPGVELFNDIKEVDIEKFKELSPDVISGGFPCQPFSCAGQKRGTEDDRHLWPRMFEVIKHTRPTWVIGENVPGIITLALDTVLDQLEGEGYATQSFVIPAAGVNAPHRRERVWILAHTESVNSNGRIDREHCAEEKRQGQTRGKSGISPDTNGKRPQGLRAEYELQKIEEKRQAGWSRCWESEPAVGRVADGIPDRVDRLRGLGNAVVPQIPYLFFEWMKKCQTQKSC